ncbi:hypothetical protein D3C72_1730160 [compost metagenome]
MRWPAPIGPACVMFSAKQASSGLHSSNKAASPPTSRFSRPSAASFGVRVMGASRKRPPLSVTTWATLMVDEGMAVEQSMMMVPGRKPSSKPPADSSTASTCGLPVTQRMITSDWAASAAPSVTLAAPAAFSASRGWLPGCSSTVRE